MLFRYLSMRLLCGQNGTARSECKKWLRHFTTKVTALAQQLLQELMYRECVVWEALDIER